jgi:hypothetical protein
MGKWLIEDEIHEKAVGKMMFENGMFLLCMEIIF